MVGEAGSSAGPARVHCSVRLAGGSPRRRLAGRTGPVRRPSGDCLATLSTLSNLNHATGYQQLTFNLSAFAGQTVRIRFRGSETDSAGGTTNFVIDDTALNVS